MIKILSSYKILYVPFEPKNQDDRLRNMATIVKKRCCCIGSHIKVFPQAPFLEHYSPNRHAIIRYRPDGSKSDAVIRTFVHSSLERAFWILENPHFLFDAQFEADSTGLPLKVKVSFTRSGVTYDADVYFMRSIVSGSCSQIKKISRFLTLQNRRHGHFISFGSTSQRRLRMTLQHGGNSITRPLPRPLSPRI